MSSKKTPAKAEPRPKVRPRPAGRGKKYTPTEQARTEVRALAGYGLTAEEICDFMGMSRSTLFEHHAEDIKLGRVRADTKVRKTLFEVAVGREAEYDPNGNKIREEIPADKGALIWWTKARLGWTDAPQTIALTNPDGSALGSEPVKVRFEFADTEHEV